jgi:hypothetical protein
MKTVTEVRESFWQYLSEVSPELAKERRSKKRQNQYCTDIRCSFVDYVDYLLKDGQISDKLANRVTL